MSCSSGNSLIISIKTSNEIYFLKHKGQSEEFTRVLNIMNYIFTALFTIEMVVKLIAFTPKVNFLTLSLLTFI